MTSDIPTHTCDASGFQSLSVKEKSETTVFQSKPHCLKSIVVRCCDSPLSVDTMDEHPYLTPETRKV